jgi:hypothetical protein
MTNTTISAREYLARFAEPLPQWLDEYQGSGDAAVRGFLGSRQVFYPGAGSDGHPLLVFGASGAAHCFVYVDYGRTRAELIEPIRRNERAGVRGYTLIGEHDLRGTDLVNRPWSPNNLSQSLKDAQPSRIQSWAHITPFATLCILERQPELDDLHGPARLAILFIGDEAISTYDILYGHQLQRAPFAMVLQDHGFGGNWESFGDGSVLWRVAEERGIFPEWILCDEAQKAWSGYQTRLTVRSDVGGMHHTARRLWQRVVGGH